MNSIIIATVSSTIIVGSVYLIMKASRSHTSGEISKLHKDIHTGIGKIDLMTAELKRVNRNFDINKRRGTS